VNMTWLDYSVALLGITSGAVSLMLWHKRRYTFYRWIPRIFITLLVFTVAAIRTVARLAGIIDGPNEAFSAMFLVILFQAVLLIATSNYQESIASKRNGGYE